MGRCYDPEHQSYRNYGARGIAVCDRWHKFRNFVNDVGYPPAGTQFDRYPNNDGNYEPGNWRWATRKENNRNKRTNRLITIGGVSKVVTDWCIESGISLSGLDNRIRNGETVEQALSRPADQRIRKDNRLLDCDGQTKTITEWARCIGVTAAAIRNRLKRGMPPEVALSFGRYDKGRGPGAKLSFQHAPGVNPMNPAGECRNSFERRG